MNKYILLSSALAVALYFPLWFQIKNKEIHQNFLAWVLWCGLDVVVAASLVCQKGNFLLPAIFVIGSGITIVLISKYGDKAKWTSFETLVLSLVLISTAVWYFSGDKMATIASTFGAVIAGWPLIADAIKDPRRAPFGVYCGYLVADGLAAVGGNSWSVRERFYPVSVTLFTLVLVLLSGRKFFLSRQTKVR